MLLNYNMISAGSCRYGVDLAKQLVTGLLSVLASCGSVRISFSDRTPEKVVLRTKILVISICDLSYTLFFS